jgi:hypothetical protein
MFPRTFRMRTPRGTKEVRLFGGLIELMEQRQQEAAASGGSLRAREMPEPAIHGAQSRSKASRLSLLLAGIRTMADGSRRARVAQVDVEDNAAVASDPR